MSQKKQNKRFNVIVCGNYGATNLGDEAILDGILKIVNLAHANAKTGKEIYITVLSANPESTALSHKIDSEFLFPAGFRSLIRGVFRGTIKRTIDAIRAADLFILGGGGLFTDEKPMAVLIWSLQARIARIYGVPVFCLGQSVGPLKTFFGRDLTRNVYLNARGATVRDKKSVELLKNLGVKNVTELADPVFALGADSRSATNKSFDGEELTISGVVGFEGKFSAVVHDVKPEKLAVFSIRPWKNKDADTFYNILAAFIIWLKREHGVKSVLVPFQILKDNDLDCLNTILDRIEKDEFAEIFEYSSDYNKVIELMSRAEFVCGMRLHSLIFSAVAGCPFIGISYSSKVSGAAKKMGMEEFVIDLKTVSLPLLTEKYEKINNDRDKVRSEMIKMSAELKAEALEHVKILSDLIKKSC